MQISLHILLAGAGESETDNRQCSHIIVKNKNFCFFVQRVLYWLARFCDKITIRITLLNKRYLNWPC